MTERKPPGVSFESFIDRQIREASERGEFRSLPGFGKPLADDSAPYDELWWIKGKMHSEGASVLPPSLALRKEAEDAEKAVAAAVSERQVRRILDEINAKIAEALLRPPSGPPLNLKPFDVEATVARWRAERKLP
ncbi:DnaJ family domain-containing protein [Streptomyces sp. NPDC006482]|uniref:DnaJ family domain-containing protein n=1 Tax=Streptomyces sp. NPDC006482 TaxID=3154306 RepID=UPI0033A64212